ncbi:septum site-determining protein MinD [archaeon BMS3Abin16]|nr:septum site-determining protein MinD [archaeon BMS3Abin16]
MAADKDLIQIQNKEEDQKILEKLKNVKHKIAVMSGKGGVGKSTVATNLSIALAAKGKKVGLLDLDLTGPNIPKMLGVEDERLMGTDEGILPIKVMDNLSVISSAYMLPHKEMAIIWRGPMKIGAIQQLLADVVWGELDYLIIDLPPGTSDEPLSVAQSIPESEGAIIVTTPQEVSLLDIYKSLNFAEKLKMPIIGIVENMSGFACPHCGETSNIFKAGGGKAAAERYKVPFLGAIPIDPKIVEDSDAGKPFVTQNPDSKAAKAFYSLVAKVEAIVEKPKEKKK